MLDAPVSCFSEAINARPALLSPGGGVDISAAGDTAITVVDAARFGYLLFLKATCIVAGTTGGDWLLKNAMGGTIILSMTQPDTGPVAGKDYCWPMPMPAKTGAKGAAFAINYSVATMGTWRWNVNGFYSAV